MPGRRLENRMETRRRNWQHYDEWWESEDRKAFEAYADQTDAEPEPEPEEPKSEQPKPEA